MDILKQRMTGKLFKAAYYVLIGLLVLLGLLLIGMQTSFIKGYELKIVQSGSMEPAIKTGSLVLIGVRDSYGVGDVITFGRDDKTHVPTTHRVIEEKRDGNVISYITKGDANEDADAGQTRARDVIGKVLFDVPYLGFILDFARKPMGFALMIGVPAAVVVYDEVAKIVGELRRPQSKVVEKKEEEEKES